MNKKLIIYKLVGLGLILVGLTVALAYVGDDIGGIFLMFMGSGLLLYGGDDED